MKHFVTLAALLTSLSAFAQLPYNPDADNNGTIGASDLTALLSVYGNGFSNGVLGVGSTMATLDMPFGSDYPYYLYNFNGYGCCSSFVVDLTLIPQSVVLAEDADINLNIGDLYNGLTITFMVPGYWGGYNPVYYNGELESIEIQFSLSAISSFQQVVWWNGQWFHQNSWGQQ